MVISTNSAYGDKIGDTVKFTCLRPYRIQITGRTKNHINVFEELMIENAEVALSKAAEVLNLDIVDYIAGNFYENKQGGHEWLIEFKNPPKDSSKFVELMDHFETKILITRQKDIKISLAGPKLEVAKKSILQLDG